MVDKFTQKLLLSPPLVRKVDFSVQIGLLERSTDVVVEIVKALRREDLKRIHIFDEKLHDLEAEADRQMLELYRELFNTQRQVLEVIALKDLYEQLEKVIDRCRDAGTVMAHVALKTLEAAGLLSGCYKARLFTA